MAKYVSVRELIRKIRENVYSMIETGEIAI